MSIKYWYKSQVESSIWVDITSQISKHVEGSTTINNVPSEFTFQVSPYIKSGSSTINSDIKIQMDDKVLVIQDDSIVIAYGTVTDDGSEIIGWDYKLNQPHQRFNLKAEEDDFSASPIDRFDYTDASISSILDEIMLYTDESLNNTIGKYILNIEDYNIAFSLEKKTPREALTELCEQIDCFWILKTSIIPDNTEIWKVYRYIEINSRSGITPDIDSDWYDGIQNRHIRDGKIENPITENRSLIPYIAGEGIPKKDPDKSMIINYIDLSCKVYESDSNTVYTRNSPIPALPNLFNYQLDGYADDIKYLAIQIKTTVLTGSTSTIVRVPSNRAANGMIQAGNKVYFPDHLDVYEESSFFEVISVTEINTTYTEIEFDTLPFTPGAGDIFEVISNVDIYRNKDDINYATKGALIDCNKSSYGKIEFLPLSEPPSGQIITAIYTKCVDYTTPIKNDESIARHGLRYKEIKIDDSIVLTRSEVQNLSSKLLQLNPVYKFSISTRRYGIVPIGLAISVKITNYITETFILNENSFEFLGAVDRNKKDVFVQNLVFSTQIGRPDKVIEKLQKLKKSTSSNASKLNQSNQKETLKIQDYITWSFNPLSGIEEPTWTPDAPTFTSITVNDADSFTFTYPLQTGVNVYRIDVATDSGFTNKIPGYNNKGIFRYGTWTVNGLAETGATTVYLRMRALSYDNIYSNYSATQTINLVIDTNLQIDANTLIALDFNEGTGSSLSSRSPATKPATIAGTTTSIWQSSAISDYSLDFNGTNNYVYTSSDNTTLTDFTIRIPFRFDTGDKTSQTTHVLASKYNTTGSNINGFVFYCEYNSNTNKLSLVINNSTSTWSVNKYRAYEVTFNFSENIDYIVQAAFKLVDSSNSNLNTAEICVNGIKITGGTWINSGITNISSIISGTIPIYLGAEIVSTGALYLGKFKAHKFYFDTCFRSEAYALQDAQNIGLA